MSQCSTSAQCLKELARVMEQFGIDNVIDAVNSKYIRSEYKADYYMSAIDLFRNPELWSFAIAEVEGKPVFIGGTLYDPNGDSAVIVKDQISVRGFKIEQCTWNPPKPRTVMVELLVEDAEHLTFLYVNRLSETAKRIDTACRQALEREGVK